MADTTVWGEGNEPAVDPIGGERMLEPEELADIEAWIIDGAAP